MKTLINSFNAGEITPLLWGRVDIEDLRRACRYLRNFIPRVFGGAFRRPSLLHVAMTHAPATHVRLIPFGVSSSARYMIELGDSYFRVFNVETKSVVFGPAASPWTAAQLDVVQFVQVNDVMWMTHPDVPIHEMIRRAEDDWTLEAMPFGSFSLASTLESQGLYPPMMDENLSLIRITPSGINTYITLTASAPLFQPGHVGSYWQIGHYRDESVHETSVPPPEKQNAISRQITSNGTPVTVYFKTEGLWTGTLFFEKFNTADDDYDIVDQWENTLGNQVHTSVSFKRTTSPAGQHGRFRVANLTVYPGPNFRLIDSAAGSGITPYFDITAPLKTSHYTPGGGLRINGGWEFYTYGRWAGDVRLERKGATGWDIVRQWKGDFDRNISASGTVDGEVSMRVRCLQMTGAAASDAAKPRFVLESSNSAVYGLVKITGYVSATQVTAEVIRPLWSTAETPYWSEGAWSAVRGYPRAVALHEQRLIFAATRKQPQTIWGSVTGDFRNFEQSGLDDSSFSYQIVAKESHPIVWLASQDGLIIGTEGDEWLMDGDGKPITPSNVRAKIQSSEGSASIQAKLVGSVVLFVQKGGLHLREYVFSWETQNYISPYVTQLVNHMTATGIRDFSFAKAPDRVLWVVTNDGRLLSCTYKREEKVIAWAQHPTNGTVEAISCVFGDDASGDEVWMVVNRFGTRRIERMDAEHWQNLESGSSPIVHLDAAVVATGDMSSVTGLTHLEGREVSVVADGAARPDAVVHDGVVAVPAGTAHAVVGLAAPCRMMPMHFETPLQDGTAQGRMHHVKGLSAGFYRTQAASYQVGENGKVYPIAFRAVTDDQDAAPPPFTGIKKLDAMADHKETVDIIISTDSPLSLNVQSLIPSVGIYGA
ncbi:hypothetical protein WJU23_05205 [Prosthecobacter sp. SYSU 5D2]|uniref:hypothetical protein n=1 Tax=Prosthecobacter sp. SYSU 5D2 TaxID=3134134 RepID=UPI0031FE5F82